MIIDVHNLETNPAINQHHLGAIIADMAAFNGWIRCKTSEPNIFAPQIVTDGRESAIGCYLENPKEWIVTNSFTQLKARNIIAWRLLPEIPQLLKENCK